MAIVMATSSAPSAVCDQIEEVESMRVTWKTATSMSSSSAVVAGCGAVDGGGWRLIGIQPDRLWCGWQMLCACTA